MSTMTLVCQAVVQPDGGAVGLGDIEPAGALAGCVEHPGKRARASQ